MIKKCLYTNCKVILLSFVYLSLSAPAFSQEIDTKALQAIMVDVETDEIILEKNPDTPMPPASMSKLMTIYMVFEKLKTGKISLKDRFYVSEKAWRKGGSKMFVMVNTRVSVSDLLRGIIVQSGNDACIVIAEGLAGTEENFAGEMTKKAKQIGLRNSVFKNATGWPAEDHYMTARDLAFLAKKLINDFPEYYPMFSEKIFVYSGIRQGNRNPLLYKKFGADGLKTGHTEASGYGLVSSTVRNGRRLVLVVNGLKSSRERASEAIRLINWGFKSTKNYTLFKKGENVGFADVWLGTQPSVPLVIDRNVTLTLNKFDRKHLKVKIVFNNPIPAPIKTNSPIGKAVISIRGQTKLEIPLTAGKDIAKLGFFGRLHSAALYLIFGRISQ
ncbi:MAG: D-alanyl-D-alanine carboxypeptidase [Rhodospirillaceae bacterium]|nr:D-alanyl-D-alanine carboxypeptidase [Rhodospirillaceae bacterium]